MAERTLPPYQQLPQLGLYLDQVQYVLEEALRPLYGGEKPLVTGTMVTNYVKQKVVSPTQKKKYSRKQLTQLLVAFSLKQVLSTAELILVLKELDEMGDEQAAYEAFCTEMDHQISPQLQEGAENCPPLTAAALRALAGKLAFEALVRQQTHS